MSIVRLSIDAVPEEDFADLVSGTGQLEVILHCADGMHKAAIAVRREVDNAAVVVRAFIDVSKE